MTQAPAATLRCVQCGHEGPSVRTTVQQPDYIYGPYRIRTFCTDPDACGKRLQAKAREQKL